MLAIVTKDFSVIPIIRFGKAGAGRTIESEKPILKVITGEGMLKS